MTSAISAALVVATHSQPKYHAPPSFVPRPIHLAFRPNSGLLATLLLGSLVSATVTANVADPPAGPAWIRHAIDAIGRGADGTKLGDINGDGWPDIVTGWEEDGTTRVYLNPGPFAVTGPWGRVTIGRTPDVEDAVFVDLDGDGRLDVVSSCEGATQRVFVHWGPPRADLLRPEAWRQDVFPVTEKVTRWMFAEPLQIDGRHGVDLVIGGRRGGNADRSVLGWLEAPASPRVVADWKWHPLLEMGWTMTIALEDMDGDGDRDILFSDRMGPTRGIYWLENPGPASVAAGVSWRKHAVGATDVHEVLFLGLGDIDGDGLVDIAAPVALAPTKGTEPDRHAAVRLLRREDASGRRWSERTLPVPTGTGNVKSIALGDIDGDGRTDLVVSCENARGERIGVYWLRQPATDSSGRWPAVNISGAAGIKFDLVRLLDLDGDGDLDVLTNEEQEGGTGLGVFWYENPRIRK